MEISQNILILSRHRWNIPIMAGLGENAGLSFTALADLLNVSRDSLNRALKFLAKPGWLAKGRERESGYQLTVKGKKIGGPCRDILTFAEREKVQDETLKRWTLPIAHSLQHWELRFAEIKHMLPDITPRALALALKEMQECGLLEREIVPGFPPTASYKLKKKGLLFLPALKKL